MVATDGHRLSLVDFHEEDGEFVDMSGGIIIPRKGISEVKKLVDNGSEHIEVGVKKGKCVFKKDDTILRISLVDSEYPEYKKVMPTDKGIPVQLDREQFLHSLKRMSVISSEKYNGVKIKIMDDTMLFNSTNPDVGEANEEIDISYKGETVEIVYNVSYLIDAVQVISGDSILFDIRPGLRPGVISEVGNDRYICIVMPLKM
jgi:DNA polymerase-3 subunit beta